MILNDQILDFLSTEKVLKKEQFGKTNIFFFYFAFTLHIQKKLAQGLTLQYDDNFYSYNDRLNLSEIIFF